MKKRPTKTIRSFLVYIFGQEVTGFREYEKTGDVSVEDIEISKVVYYKTTHDSYKTAGASGDESYLVVKDLRSGEEQLVFTGNLGHNIKYVFVDKENQRLYYTLNGVREDFDRYFLVVYDLNAACEVKKIMMADIGVYRNANLFLGGGGLMTGAVFDEAKRTMYYNVNYRLNKVYYDGRAYFALDTGSEEVTEISKEMYEKFRSDNVSKYSVLKTQKWLYEIDSPNQSEYLTGNYKPKYNGIYVEDGNNNIRLTKNTEQYYVWSSFWLNDGQYVINGSYLYDTSGMKREKRIADGAVIAVY